MRVICNGDDDDDVMFWDTYWYQFFLKYIVSDGGGFCYFLKYLS